jgi:hypothetical protein
LFVGATPRGVAWNGEAGQRPGHDQLARRLADDERGSLRPTLGEALAISGGANIDRPTSKTRFLGNGSLPYSFEQVVCRSARIAPSMRPRRAGHRAVAMAA